MSQVVCMAYKRGPKLFKDSKEHPALSYCLKGVCVFLYTGLVLCPINTALRRENCIFMWSMEQQSNKEVLGLWWVGLINLCVLCSEKTEQKTKNGYSIQTNFRNTAVSTNLVFLPGATFTK